MDCRNNRRQTGYKYISCSQTTGAGAHAREIEAAVNDAVAAFGSPRDFRIWAWYAHRIGLADFLELFFEQQSILRECRLRNPAAAFHRRLQRCYAARMKQ